MNDNPRITPTEMASVLQELKTIRRAQDHLYEAISKIDGKIVGNGKPGLQDRLVVLETTAEMREKSKGTMIALGTAIMSSVVALYAAIVK